VSKSFIISGLQIFAEDRIYQNGYIKVVDEKIAEIGDSFQLEEQSSVPEINFSSEDVLLPGFIDIHIHGAGGFDVMDASEEAISTISKTLPKEGTTSYLATTITQSDLAIEKALKNINEYKVNGHNHSGRAELIGVHLEGPFISSKKAGAQPQGFIQQPNICKFENWQENSNYEIKLVTLAPEEVNGLDFIKYLDYKGIVASIGHSNATFEQVKEATKLGVSHVTHLYNQMTGLHHREPGVVGAALLNGELTSELIADGIHVVPEMIDFTYDYIGKDRLILITDAIRAKGLGDGVYDLGGQVVTVDKNRATLEDGTLAGSVLEMNKALHNMAIFTNAPLQDLVQIASTNPAKKLNIFDRKGSLKKGKDADLVVLNQNYEVLLTVCKGEVAYNKGVEG
jgi:N-acetylglucosamine-6-phosphate deacetylase